MIGRGSSSRTIATTRASRGVSATRFVTDWLTNLPGNRYSRRVAMMKLALPTIGIGLLLMVTIWPRVAPLFDRLRFNKIDLREARELRMINPRYGGTDRSGHPFIITAAVGRQIPARDDVMALDQPRADLQSHTGAAIVVTADSGVYQSQTQFLDLFGHVTLTHENGTTIVTSSARLDTTNDAAEGHEAVEGHGPSGDIKAEGFQVIDKGAIVIFTGNSDLWLRGSKTASAAAPQPAALPAPVAQAAAQIEAKVTPAAESKLTAAKPGPRPAAHPAPPHAAKSPDHPKPATKKPS
jgi:lipopolysaccharide export system protein LptC